ncbi:pectin lyase fold/virulence factor, partial [Baffinella frigidus]
MSAPTSPGRVRAASGLTRSAARALQLLLALALALAAAGVEVHVDPAGAWADQVEAAGAGTTVVFAPGRYVNCSAGGVALASGVALAGSAGAAATVIDCGGAGRHFAVGGGASVQIDGLTLTGGAAPHEGNISRDGGCVLVEGPGGSLVVADSVFSNCSADAWGGAIAVRGNATLNISRSNFTGNAAGEGGGSIYAAAGNVTLSDSVFSDCRSDAFGGALAVSGSAALSISRSNFMGNAAGEAGGSIHATAGEVFLEDSVFSSCSAVKLGGVIAVSGSARLSISRSDFTGNNAGVEGGAVHATAGEVTLADSVFSSCSAVKWGGAIAVSGSAALTISRSNFTGNAAREGGA